MFENTWRISCISQRWFCRYHQVCLWQKRILYLKGSAKYQFHLWSILQSPEKRHGPVYKQCSHSKSNYFYGSYASSEWKGNILIIEAQYFERFLIKINFKSCSCIKEWSSSKICLKIWSCITERLRRRGRIRNFRWRIVSWAQLKNVKRNWRATCKRTLKY